ncbi:MAG: hypothetical protein K6C14_00290 [Eubacterium sp.]|nr:hypothetical protein [Eubacterium sp.]
MQKFLVKQGLCAAICITMAFTLCTYTAVTISEARLSVVAELGARAAEQFETAAVQKVNNVKAAAQCITGAAPTVFNVLKAEITQAIVPEP